MILTFTFDALQRAFPNVASRIPLQVSSDTRYIYRLDTISGLAEFGYPEDEWLLK